VRWYPVAVLAALLVLSTSGCSSHKHTATQPTAAAATRPYQLAFTPWPAELNDASFEEALGFCGAHGDVVAHHLDNGVPWDSALAGRPPEAALIENLIHRRDRTLALGCKSYVAIGLLSAARDSIAGGWGGAPRPPAIAAEPDFANPAVRHALRWWCAYVAMLMLPDRCAVGIEINDYLAAQPADWDSLRTLYSSIYDTLKTLRPAMQVFPTWQLQTLADGGQWGAMAALGTRMDAIALSSYPALSTSERLPSQFPTDYLGRARTLPGLALKPLLVSETGYADSTFAPWDWPGSSKLQADYLRWLLHQADSLRIEQVTWFFPSDAWAVYDAQPSALNAFFSPMGLRRRDLTPKPALAIWDSALARPYSSR